MRWLGGILVAGLAAPRLAVACGCVTVPIGTVPAFDGAEMPVDGPFYVHWPSAVAVDYELVDLGTGAVTAVTTETWRIDGDTVWHRIVPVAPLQPDTEYELMQQGAYQADPSVVRFRTAAGAAVVPGEVSLGDLTGIWSLAGATCGEGGRIAGPVTVVGGDAAWLELQVSRSADFASVEEVVVGVDDYLFFGASSCYTNVDSLQAGEQVWVRARAVNVEAVAGAWSAGAEVVVEGEAPPAVDTGAAPAEDTAVAADTGSVGDTGAANPVADASESAAGGCGCSTGPAPTWAWLVGLVVLVCRRGGR